MMGASHFCKHIRCGGALARAPLPGWSYKNGMLPVNVQGALSDEKSQTAA
jgi:hypothetical protein